jgi:uracil phosphoribosyltransferase
MLVMSRRLRTFLRVHSLSCPSQLFYSKLPPCIKEKTSVILVDPMLATGGSAIKAIEVLS